MRIKGAWHSVMTWRDGMEEGRKAPELCAICIIMVDLHHCMAKTDTALQKVKKQKNLKN